MAQARQHHPPALVPWLRPTRAGGRAAAGCASPTSSAGHPGRGAPADHALTIDLDHPMGAGRMRWLIRRAAFVSAPAWLGNRRGARRAGQTCPSSLLLGVPPLALEVRLATLLGPSLASARLWLTLPCLIRHAVLACSPRGHCPTVGAPSTMRRCGRRRPRPMRLSGTARQATVVSHAHVLDRGQHLLPILAHTDHDEERDRGRLAVEPQNGWLMRGRPHEVVRVEC